MLREPRLTNPLARRGTIAPFLLIGMSVFLAAFAFAINKNWLWTVREDLRTAADAAALAAMHSFIDDDLLRGEVNRYPELLIRATDSATQLAQRNLVRGQPLPLLDNPDNDPRGDLVFGIVSLPRAGDFTPVPSWQIPDDIQAGTNAVVVQARLTRNRGNAPGIIFGAFAGINAVDAQAVSGVAFDRGVRGFRPLYGNVPLAPLAILSDVTAIEPRSWEHQVEHRNGPDGQRFDKSLNAFVSDPAGDRIHEFAASYATANDQIAATNIIMLNVGTSDLARIASQVEQGLSRDDLSIYDGKIILHESDGLDIGGQQYGPDGGSPEIQSLAQALTNLRQQAAVRIWPLYSTFTAGQVRLTGFVAARVVSVTTPQPGQPLAFTLQATVISRPDAITDTDLRGRAATMNNNVYVGKIRRVE